MFAPGHPVVCVQQRSILRVKFTIQGVVGYFLQIHYQFCLIYIKSLIFSGYCLRRKSRCNLRQPVRLVELGDHRFGNGKTFFFKRDYRSFFMNCNLTQINTFQTDNFSSMNKIQNSSQFYKKRRSI